MFSVSPLHDWPPVFIQILIFASTAFQPLLRAFLSILIFMTLPSCFQSFYSCFYLREFLFTFRPWGPRLRHSENLSYLDATVIPYRHNNRSILPLVRQMAAAMISFIAEADDRQYSSRHFFPERLKELDIRFSRWRLLLRLWARFTNIRKSPLLFCYIDFD